jgi:uncharacterized protein YndB with AHSA1/START domain
MTSAARAIADLEAGTILATVDIAAPPERVFRALTSDEITKWWGSPDMYQTTGYTADLRVGGAWKATGVGSDGSPFAVEGEFLEIDPPHRLVQTWKPGWDPIGATTLTYHLAAISTGTRVTLRHTGFGANRESCGHHAFGWERVFGWLAGHFAPSGERKPYLVRLIAPRATFPQDMTDAERGLMMQHVAYCKEQLAVGNAVVFGPVADPKGAWGLGVIRATDDAGVAAFAAGDPIVRANLGFRYEVVPMMNVMVRD